MWVQTDLGNIVNLKKAKFIGIEFSDVSPKIFVIAEFGKDYKFRFKTFDDVKSAKAYVEKLFFRLCGSSNKKKEAQE